MQKENEVLELLEKISEQNDEILSLLKKDKLTAKPQPGTSTPPPPPPDDDDGDDPGN